MFPPDLAKRIQADSNFHGQPILLASCNTGKDGGKDEHGNAQLPFAQQLANILNTTVRSPVDFTYFPANRQFYAGTKRTPYNGGPLA